MFKLELNPRIVRTRKSTPETVPTEEPTPDYVAIAEEAASRLGKKLLIGAVVVVATYVVLSVAGSLAESAFENTITND